MSHSDHSSQASAFLITAAGHAQIREMALAPYDDEQVLVKTLFTGISRGTESLVLHAQQPKLVCKPLWG